MEVIQVGVVLVSKVNEHERQQIPGAIYKAKKMVRSARKSNRNHELLYGHGHFN